MLCSPPLSQLHHFWTSCVLLLSCSAVTQHTGAWRRDGRARTAGAEVQLQCSSPSFSRKVLTFYMLLHLTLLKPKTKQKMAVLEAFWNRNIEPQWASCSKGPQNPGICYLSHIKSNSFWADQLTCANAQVEGLSETSWCVGQEPLKHFVRALFHARQPQASTSLSLILSITKQKSCCGREGTGDTSYHMDWLLLAASFPQAQTGLNSLQGHTKLGTKRHTGKFGLQILSVSCGFSY